MSQLQLNKYVYNCWSVYVCLYLHKHKYVYNLIYNILCLYNILLFWRVLLSFNWATIDVTAAAATTAAALVLWNSLLTSTKHCNIALACVCVCVWAACVHVLVRVLCATYVYCIILVLASHAHSHSHTHSLLLPTPTHLHSPWQPKRERVCEWVNVCVCHKCIKLQPWNVYALGLSIMHLYVCVCYISTLVKPALELIFYCIFFPLCTEWETLICKNKVSSLSQNLRTGVALLERPRPLAIFFMECANSNNNNAYSTVSFSPACDAIFSYFCFSCCCFLLFVVWSSSYRVEEAFDVLLIMKPEPFCVLRITPTTTTTTVETGVK